MTQEQQDKYYRKHYGISLAEYNEQLGRQGGGCAICGRPAKTRALHADHDHAVRKLKVHTSKIDGKWFASVPEANILVPGLNKRDAIQLARAHLKRKSFRGIVCYRHNRGLQMFSDNPAWLRWAADYLDLYKRRLYGDNGKCDAGAIGSVVRTGYLVAQDARAVDPGVESTGRILLPGQQVSELAVNS